MTKQDKPSLINSARPFSKQLIAIISLIAVACLSIGIAAYRDLEVFQRWILVTFQILFAVFGLIISLWLILRESRRTAIGKSNKDIIWQVSSSENQKEKLNNDVRELAAILEISDEQLSDLLSAYVVAEDLALRKIQQEEKKPLFRHVSIDKTEFDAVLLNEDTINFIEVAFLVRPDLPQKKINLIARKIVSAGKFIEKNYSDSKIKLLLVLVTQLDRADDIKLRSTLNKERFSGVPVDMDINFYDFEDLQKVYAMD
ncbi:MAG: hypothetical protein ACR2MG_15800 [Pyrinomonadaceae bacterium]